MNIVKKIEESRVSEKEYRSLKDRISYSALKKFNENRKAFYKEYICGEAPSEKPNISLTLGQMVHSLLSGGQEECENRFVLSSVTPPLGQMLELVNNLYARAMKTLDRESGKITETFQTLFLDAVNATKYDYNLQEVAFKGKSAEKILELFQGIEKKTGFSGEQYYEELLKNYNKTVVTEGDYKRAEDLVAKIKQHNTTFKYANAKTIEGKQEVINELPIFFEIEGIPYKIMPDRMIIKHDEKKITPLDWKTTWEIYDVQNNYLKNSYYIQAALYDVGINEWKTRVGMQDYEVEPMKFVFLDVSDFEDPVILELSHLDLEMALNGFKVDSRKYKGTAVLIKEVAWHLSTGIWSSSMDIAKCKGMKKITLNYLEYPQ